MSTPSTLETKSLRIAPFESPKHDEFFHEIQSNPNASPNSSWHLEQPATRETTNTIRKDIKRDSILFVVLCLRDKKAENPIGVLYIKCPGYMAHNRCVELNLGFTNPRDFTDYAFEAIDWARQWAFQNRQVNRVEFKVAAWKAKFRVDYEFKLESKKEGGLVKDGVRYDELCLVSEKW
ncbi:Acyl-CoA N-acyltransferase [Penicillium frequentans]|uniref:Acyl-CoA N-acyltransferase n=1 Tax=Penicillium frequentans TaxID=3151616 RepID=A0AAD6D6H3_9EURO|nr:Acyl-CoA N-acyltransferase [Penicillium glabrum]